MTPQLEKVDILVVDDKPDNLVAFDAILRELDQNLVFARSGREALRHLLRREFALILLDVNMPGLDGFETAALIRQHQRFRATPIIFLTASGDDVHVARSYSLGAVDYLLAPVAPDVLRTKVRAFVELWQRTAEVKRQADALRVRASQLQKLASASLAINSALSLDRMLRAITDAARDVVGAHQAITTAALGRPFDAGGSVVSFSERYRGPGEERVARPRDAMYALVCGENRAVRMTERELVARPELLAGRLGVGTEGDGLGSRPPLRGWLAAPLLERDGRNMGLIELSEKVEGEFNEDDEAILVQLAQLASIAIRNCLDAEAREANRLKDEFLATLSHELRTPLNAILGWTQMLRGGEAAPAKVARGLEVIERNAHAQTKLIEELLDVSRITSGTLRVSMRTITLASVVEAAIDAIRPVAEKKSLRIDATLDADAGLVFGDSDRLHQAATNLLTNAIKFSRKGDRIEVRLGRAQAGGVELQVIDEGEGISAEFLPFVFERFRQAESTIRRRHGGLGIGLAVVRHIVELHDGSVEVESDGEGRGARFRIRLPAFATGELSTSAPAPVGPSAAATAARAADASRAPAAPPRALEGLSVLLVEDDADARELVVETLAGERAAVTAVTSVREALAALDRQSHDVLISDLGMPTEDGFELIRSVRKRPPERGGAVPALALTAYARDEDRARALAAGFQAHAPKPIDPAALIVEVVRLAAGARAAQSSEGARAPAPLEAVS